MCLAKAYIVGQKEMVMTDVALVEINDGKLLMRTLFGEEKEVSGRIKSIDFMKSSITLETA